MKKIYYFSKEKLQFQEINNYTTKLIVYFSLSVITFSALIFAGYFYLQILTGSAQSLLAVKAENSLLKNKLNLVTKKYSKLNTQIDSLFANDYQLRLVTNLLPVSKDERELGIGGGSFDNSIDFINNGASKKIKYLLSFVDKVSRKIDFEKSNFLEISTKLKENEKLYASLPAIQPSAGLVRHDFGMRLHPILKIRRMHAGIDILSNTGTKVHATGNGKVIFTGTKGGYGKSVEIDHGFGYTTLYTHLSKILVRRGKKVKRGDVIAKTGNTGLSTGPHLHYEVRNNGKALNPINFFFEDFNYFAKTKKDK